MYGKDNEYNSYDPGGSSTKELMARLMQMQGKITSTISEVTRIDGDVSSVSEKQSQISQDVDSIELSVSALDTDINDATNGLKTRMTSAESSISLNADEIALRVTKTTYETDITAAGTGLIDRMTSAESSITQNADDITLKVEKTTYANDVTAVGTGLKDRMTSAESSISLNADNILLRVEKDKVISEINQSAEAIRIAANKVQIDGTTVFSSGYDPTTKETPTGAQTKASTAESNAKAHANKISTKGLGMKVNYSTFTGINGGELYMHGYDSDGNAADIDGYLIVNGEKMTVSKGMINPNRHVSKAYITYSLKSGWFLTEVEGADKFRIRQSGHTSDGQLYSPAAAQVHVGVVQMDGAENFTHAVLWNDYKDHTELTRLAQAEYAESNAKTYTDSLKNSLGSLAYDSLVEKAKLGTTVINGGYLVTDLIEAGSILSDKLHVLAKDHVNNWTKTGTLDGWSTSGLSLVTDTVRGRVVKFTSSGNIGNFSDYIPVDSSKTYKVSMGVKFSPNNGSQYFGLYAYDKDGNNIGVYRFVHSSRSFQTTLDTNPYFWNTSGDVTDWFDTEFYIIGCTVTDPTEVPESKIFSGAGYNYSHKMDPRTTHVRLRFLNYYQASGTTTTSYWHSPSMTELGSGVITANQIKSLNGLNVGNGQFVVDGSGNVTVGGKLNGATGTFKGDISGSTITGSSFETDSGTGYYMTVESGHAVAENSDGFYTLLNSEGLFGGFGYLTANQTTDMRITKNEIDLEYGTAIRSVDEWLRINDLGEYTSGVYFGSGSAVVRTDGEFQVGSNGSSFKANSSGVTTAAIYGKTLNSYMLRDHGNGNVTVNSLGGTLLLGYVNTNYADLYSDMYIQSGKKIIARGSETGFMGIGQYISSGNTGVIIGTGINFRAQKNYTPTSISIAQSSAVLSNSSGLKIADITPDGFWLYIENQTAGLRYWRGTYTG